MCFIWLAAEVARERTVGFDTRTRAAIHSISSPMLTAAMRMTTALGSQEIVLGLSAGVTIGLLLGGWRRAAFLVLITMSGAELWLAVLKELFHRHRPDPFFGTIVSQSYSFPSGHALLSLCCYGLLAGLASVRLRGAARWVVQIVAAILILAIGFSRVYLGAHYPTDSASIRRRRIRRCGCCRRRRPSGSPATP